MRKSISTVIALSLSFAPLITHAASLSTKGSTQTTIHGFTYAEFAWYKQTTNLPDLSNMPQPDPNSIAKYNTPLYRKTYNDVNAKAESWLTRIYLGFKNPDKRLKGLIVGDFKGKDTNGNRGNVRLRQVWFQHELNSFKIRIGQAYILEEMRSSISFASEKPAGYENKKMKRVPLVRLSTSIDLEKVNINLALAFQSGNKIAVNSGKDTKNKALFVNRYTVPYPAARVITIFATGFGAPAEVYAWGAVIPVFVSDRNGEISDKSETSYAFGAGFRLPIHMFKLGFDFHHTEGATGYSGLTDFEPASYLFKQ